MEVDWDLHAVVRACCSTTSAAATTSSAATITAGAATSWPENKFNQQNISFQDENFMGFFPDPFNDNSIEQFLNDLSNPLDFKKVQKLPQSTPSLPISPLSVLSGLHDPPLHHQHHHHQQQQQQQQKQIQGKQQSFGITRCTNSNAQSTRSKKR